MLSCSEFYRSFCNSVKTFPDSKFHGAHPDGPHVGPMNFMITVSCTNTSDTFDRGSCILLDIRIMKPLMTLTILAVLDKLAKYFVLPFPIDTILTLSNRTAVSQHSIFPMPNVTYMAINVVNGHMPDTAGRLRIDIRLPTDNWGTSVVKYYRYYKFLTKSKSFSC